MDERKNNLGASTEEIDKKKKLYLWFLVFLKKMKTKFPRGN
jgi:hypothetical protein